MPKTHRRVDHDQFWREAIAAWKASGQSVTAFCAARGLAESTFHLKRRTLTFPNSSRPTPPADPTFAAVRLIPDPTVEIIVPGGLILRVPAGARLVLALWGEPC